MTTGTLRSFTRPTTRDTDPTGTDPTGRLQPGDLWFSSPRLRLLGRGPFTRLPCAPGATPPQLPQPITGTTGGGHRPGAGAIGFGAFPFDARQPAELLVPRCVFVQDPSGGRWVTTVLGSDDPTLHEAALAEALASPRAAPTDPTGSTDSGVRLDDRDLPEFVVRSRTPPGRWCEAVAETTRLIRHTGQHPGADAALTKVVLARDILVQANHPFDVPEVLWRLCSAHPSSLVFHIDGFVGASPELLVSRFGDLVQAQPMAGTLPRTGHTTADAQSAADLVHSPKMRIEHQITIDMVHDTLLPWCSYLDAQPEPSVVAAGPVQHLATTVRGRLSHPPPSVLELVAALHPTPAVGGWPRQAALAHIARVEARPRGRYAGPVGWVDANGNGEWAVGIRSAEIDGATATLWAGVGVVADSDPHAELAETRDKLAALLPLLIRP